MEKEIFIYGLFNPMNDECFYIGKTNNLKGRFAHHISGKSKDRNSYKKNKINQLLRNGIMPIMKHLSLSEFENDLYKPTKKHPNKWAVVEIKCIAYAKECLGWKLTNITEGGEGGHGGGNNKPVLQFDLNGNYIKSFKSAMEAERIIGICDSSISKCCKKKNESKSAGGYQWCYVGDEAGIGVYNINVSDGDTKYNKLKSKPVLQFSINNVFIARHKSTKAAARNTGINVSSIKNNLKGRSNYAGGYVWKYDEKI